MTKSERNQIIKWANTLTDDELKKNIMMLHSILLTHYQKRCTSVVGSCVKKQTY